MSTDIDRSRIDRLAEWMGWRLRPPGCGEGSYQKQDYSIQWNWCPLTFRDDIALVEAEIIRRGLGQRYELALRAVIVEGGRNPDEGLALITASAEVRARACERVISDLEQ